MNKKIFSREFSLCFSSILILVLVIVLVPLLQFYLHEQNKIIGAYASPSNTTLYFDCGNSPDKLTIEALPVTPQAQYTMWLFETSIKLGNSTTAMTSGESNTLGNGQGLFFWSGSCVRAPLWPFSRPSGSQRRNLGSPKTDIAVVGR